MSGSAPEEGILRVTIDTNLFISGVIGRGAPREFMRAWNRGHFRLVLSQSVTDEVAEVIRRPYFAEHYGVTPRRILRLERRLRRRAANLAQLAPLPAGVSVRDPKDEHVLQTALSGRADYLISGDGDLLDLNGHPSLGQVQIVTVTDFLAVLAQ